MFQMMGYSQIRAGDHSGTGPCRAWAGQSRGQTAQCPSLNPFHKMELEYHPKPTRAVTHAELLRFVMEADEECEAQLVQQP
jgi:hypothetical protein